MLSCCLELFFSYFCHHWVILTESFLYPFYFLKFQLFSCNIYFCLILHQAACFCCCYWKLALLHTEMVCCKTEVKYLTVRNMFLTGQTQKLVRAASWPKLPAWLFIDLYDEDFTPGPIDFASLHLDIT